MQTKTDPVQLAEAIESKLHRHFGRNSKTASSQQVFRACAMVLRDMTAELYEEASDILSRPVRQVHYMSLEFLLGRSLGKNAYNAGVMEDLGAALEMLGHNLSDIMETEPDAGLGNGGLGRLAACYLESMTTLGIPATGYSLCYEFGIFKQRIIDGQQVELPDPWLDISDVWLVPRMEEAVSVKFGGHIETGMEHGRVSYNHVDYTEVLAVPKDMPISGYGLENVNILRLWDAQSPTHFDMELFSRGEYMKAMEQTAMAGVINKVLYPADNHMEGKLLRLRQQYFFASATIQSIASAHRVKFGALDNFHHRHILHINDTHPTLAIPELMRILIDEEHMDWDKAWHITSHSFAYTNHTVMSEALECWPQGLIEMLLPRIWQILCEINDRYVGMLWEIFRDEVRVSECAIIWNGQVRMANLCVYTCTAVNGVSELHSQIIKDDLFRHQNDLWPHKFLSVTNGVDHRRWLSAVNPGLDSLIRELCGSDDYLLKPRELEKLSAFSSDKHVQDRLEVIKLMNKDRFTAWLYKDQGIKLDSSSMFDVQVKRLHEYKRQLLNVLHIITLYNRLCDDPGMDFVPRTFLFGAKAAAGYYMAKRIIRLIVSLQNHIAADKRMDGKLSVVFLENYRVSLSELLMPASELSEQISTAGKEASGTGNMKFMMNGALTIGTMDGANVEINELVGDDNMFIFGLRADEVAAMRAEGAYEPRLYANRNPELRRVLDQLSAGFSDGVEYSDIVQALLIGEGYGSTPDPYFVLADFDAYCAAQQEVSKTYRDKTKWDKMSLENIAASGFFASDRSIAQYAKKIWNVRANRVFDNR